jgi:hypothetical protein
LKIVVGGGVSSGNNSIVVAPNDTDATTCERENRSVGIENFSYDPNSDTFITTNHNINIRDFFFQWENPFSQTNLVHHPIPFRFIGSLEKQNCHKIKRSEYGGSSTAIGINNQDNVLGNHYIGIMTIAVNFEKISNMMEKREKDRDRELEGII